MRLSLKRKPQRVIAMISAGNLSREYYARVTSELSVRLRRLQPQYRLEVFLPDGGEEFSPKFQRDAFVDVLRDPRKQAACVFLTPAIHDQQLYEAVRAVREKDSLPVMTMDVGFGERQGAMADRQLLPLCVKLDEHKGGVLAARCLFSHFQTAGGNRLSDPQNLRVCILKGRQHGAKRQQGFVDAWTTLLHDRGGSGMATSGGGDGVFVRDTPSWSARDAEKVVRLLVREGGLPDAFFCFNDEMALAVRSCLLSLKKQAAIVGFDGNEWVKDLALFEADDIVATIDAMVEIQAQLVVEALSGHLEHGSGDLSVDRPADDMVRTVQPTPVYRESLDVNHLTEEK